MFEKEIDGHLQAIADYTAKEYNHREAFGEAKARLTILMAKYIDKSSASFDNKIQLLFKFPEISEEVEKLSNSFIMDEIYYKKYRDLAELYRLKTFELQSQRKAKLIL